MKKKHDQGKGCCIRDNKKCTAIENTTPPQTFTRQLREQWKGAREKTVEILTAEMMKDQFLTTDRMLKTVHENTKSRKSYTDLETDIDIQVLNVLDMGGTLHCANVIAST